MHGLGPCDAGSSPAGEIILVLTIKGDYQQQREATIREWETLADKI